MSPQSPANYNPRASTWGEWFFGGRVEDYQFSPYFAYQDQYGPERTQLGQFAARGRSWFNQTSAGKFLSRDPAEHLRLAAASAKTMAGYGLRDASGAAFFQGAYHRLRSFGYPQDTWGFRYHKARAGGHTDASARVHIRSKWPRPTDWSDMRRAAPAASKPLLRAGYLAGGIALGTNLHLAVQNPFGPFYGFGVTTAGFTAALPAIRMGWGLGATAGRSTRGMWGVLGRGLSHMGSGISAAGGAAVETARASRDLAQALRASRFSGWQTTGRVIGGVSSGVGFGGRVLGKLGGGLTKAAGFILGGSRAAQAVITGLTGAATIGGAVLGAGVGIAVPLALEYAATELPKLGHRLSRRGFGNLYGPYQDNRVALTMRQQAVAAMSQSQLNARNALGGEAVLLHLT